MREKLIELLGEDVCKHDCCDDCEHQGSTDACVAELKAQMADHLIANGVAVFECGYDCKNCWKTQLCTPKWIPVTERLPDDRELVLCFTQGGYGRRVAILTFAQSLEALHKYDFEGQKHSGFVNYDSEVGYYEVSGVTHWMPLPEPPKEDAE